jgi:hypothetical protein
MEESSLNRNTPLGVKLSQIRPSAYAETLIKLHFINDLEPRND